MKEIKIVVIQVIIVLKRMVEVEIAPNDKQFYCYGKSRYFIRDYPKKKNKGKEKAKGEANLAT